MTERALTPVPRLLSACLHLLVLALLVLATVRAFLGAAEHPGGVLIAAVVVGAVYLTGPLLSGVRRSAAGAGLWLAVLLVAWLGLLVLTPDAVWLAFAWYFLLLHLLPWRVGLVLVGITAAVAVAGFAWHQREFMVAMAVGPVLGAAVVVATVWGFQQLHAESERRRALIAELTATRAELAAAEREQGVLAERERLAREIHDTLTQGFSSVNLLLTAAGRQLAGHPGLDGPAGYVEQARQVSLDNLREARSLVRALAPPDLRATSLTDALRRLADRTRTPEVTLRTEGEPFALPTAWEVALLRIAQSALANTVAHAGATRATITLTFLAGEVHLDLVDDGSGFDPADLPDGPGPEGGFGLASMRSRAAELGGTLVVESAPGAGTAVSVRFAGEVEHEER
ncbi:sensor histidine kinase [Ruania albidiflava]|uniref:sensor histidine kinase n=1 Tax=Ruania albidiflava TaxID=366586 RepID=UPI0023F22A31|nr:sensor histidine kinase [Ruania albidiflava]